MKGEGGGGLWDGWTTFFLTFRVFYIRLIIKIILNLKISPEFQAMQNCLWRWWIFLLSGVQLAQEGFASILSSNEETMD